MIKIDQKDKQILYLLHRNCRLPNTKIAKIVKLSKDGVKYRIKRLLKLGIIKKFFLGIDETKLGFTLYNVFLRVQNVNEQKEKKIVNDLINNKNVIWVASCSGSWDLWIEIVAKTIQEFDEILTKIINKLGPSLKDYKTLITINEYKDYRTICDEYFKNIRLNYIKKKIKPSKEKKIDLNDYKILKILDANARTSILDLNKKSKLSIDVIRYRIRKLEGMGIIYSWDITADITKIGYTLYLVFLTLQNLTLEKENTLKSYLKSNPFVRYAHKTTGKQEVLLEILAPTLEKFQNIVTDIRNNFSDLIVGYDTLAVFKDYKDTTLPPID